MDKSQKIKNATRNTRKELFKQWLKKAVAWPKKACKSAWAFCVRQCKALWNWLKRIDLVGMVNLTLLTAIVVLIVSLLSDFGKGSQQNIQVVQNDKNQVVNVENRKLNEPRFVRRHLNTALPVRADAKTGLKPQVKVAGKKTPVIIKQKSSSQKELAKQKLSGDVIVDFDEKSPVLSNGVNINGNLFIQNLHRYTLPCGTKIEGHLFIRNVDKLSFCGEFTVKGNIYVNRQSSFGPIPSNARVGGQVLL